MKRQSTVLFISGGVIALLVAIAVGAIVASSRPRYVPYLLLRHELAAGQPLAVSDLEFGHAPPSAVPPAALTDPSSALGRYAAHTLPTGTVLVPGDLSARADMQVPTGNVLISLAVPAADAVDGALAPSQRVDVLAAVSQPTPESLVLLPAVRVQAVLAPTSSNADVVVTLDITSPQAVQLALAESSSARLFIALLGPHGSTPPPLPAASLATTG